MAYAQVSYGSTGSSVSALQEKLNANGYDLEVDGQFGPATQKAVKDYQKKKGLQVDGIAGQETWGSLLNSPAASTEPTTGIWKGIPSTRSYDVIGIRGFDFEFRNGSQNGEQIYVLNNQYTTIDYAWDGTNIRRHDNGFGISMNIVNSNITALQLTVECDVKATSNYPAVYGSYQHAVQSLSLADSQNYTLSGEGLGNVFVFPYSISQKYDGMSGVYVQY